MKHLQVFSGRNEHEAVQKIMHEVFAQEIALLYNLSGKGRYGKKAFQNLRLYRVIFGKF